MIDVFKVGVHIGMTTNANQILSTMLRHLLGVNVAAGHVSTSLSKIRTAALGAGAVFAGWEVLKGLYDATKHAEKLNHELVKLQTGARLTDKQTAEAGVDAFRVARAVPGTEVHEITKMRRELFGTFGDMKTANSLVEEVAQGSRAVSNFVDKDTDLAQIAVRALELRGHITKDHKVDPKEFSLEFSAMVRSIVASEGLIDPAKLLQFIQQAGPAARLMSTDEMWGTAPAIMNALGSSKAGTATMSLFSQMVGHVVAGQRVAIAMQEAGMLIPGKWKVERGGKVRMDQDAVPDQAGFMNHPFEWLHDKMTELRARKGPDGKPLDEVGIMQRIFQFSSRATSARLISDVDANWPIIENEKKRFQRMPDHPAVINKEQNEKDLSVNVKNLTTAWGNFMAALGGPGVPIMIDALQHITDGLNLMQKSIIAHPEAAKYLFELAGGIAAITALSGVILIFTVAVGPFVAGLRLLVNIGSLAATGQGLTGVAGGLSAIGSAGVFTLGAALSTVAVGLSAVAAVVYNIEAIAAHMPGSGHTGIGDAIGNFIGDAASGKMPTIPGFKNPAKERQFGPDGNRLPSVLPGPRSEGPTTNGDGTPTPGHEFYPNLGKQSSAEPVYVHIVNVADLSRGMSGGMASAASRPNAGPSGQDYRMNLPQPGLGNIS